MHHHHSERFQQVQKTTVVNSSTNAVLACLKIVLGYFGHSQALIADGIHSFSDLITDALVYFAAKFADQRPDLEHPYGHRRIETVATIIISLILIGVAIGIGYDNFSHIFNQSELVKPDYFVIIIAVISVFANEFLYHYTLHKGNLIDSDLLRTNAWHNRSDALVSIIVLISVVGSLLGANYLDAIGAIVIALLILKMAIKMIWTSIKELIDTGVEKELFQKISQYIRNNPGVIGIHQLRTRCHGNQIFLDVHIEVNPEISISEGHYISEQVTHDLIKHFDKIIDVTVHIDPENDERFMLSKNLPTRNSIEAQLQKHWQSIPSYPQIEKIILHYLNGKIQVEVYLPASTNVETNQYQEIIQHVPYINQVNLYSSKQDK